MHSPTKHLAALGLDLGDVDDLLGAQCRQCAGRSRRLAGSRRHRTRARTREEERRVPIRKRKASVEGLVAAAGSLLRLLDESVWACVCLSLMLANVQLERAKGTA